MENLKNMSMKLYLMLAVFAAAAFAGCKEDEEVVTPKFPDLKEQTVALTETTDEDGNKIMSATLDITFSANLDWTIKSDAAWCKFVNGEFKETSASGKAGDQTLKIEILPDDKWDYTIANVVQLTLGMADKEQVIYRITVSSMEQQGLVVKNEAGEVLGLESPLTIKGSGLRDIPMDKVYTVITAVSNGSVGIKEYPEWLTVENVDNGVFKLIFNNDNNLEEPVNSFGVEKGYKLVVSDNETDVEIPLIYEGLKAESVSFTDNEADGYPTKLYANAEGTVFTYRSSNGMSGEVEEENFNAPLSTSITARDGKYHVLVLGMIEGVAPNQAPYYEIDDKADISWVKCTTNDEKLELKVDPLDGEERGATIMVFSEAHWNAIQNDSLTKYNGSLVDAIFTKDMVYSNNGEEKYSYVVKNEYEVNRWIDVFQEKEEPVIEGISFEAYYYNYYEGSYGGSSTWMTFEDMINQSMDFGQKIENISGTEEAKEATQGMNVSNVWKITCPNSITAGKFEDEYGKSTTYLAIQANGLGQNEVFGLIDTVQGVTIGELQKDDKTLVSVDAPGYVGRFGLVVMDTSTNEKKAYLIIDITAQ